MLFKDIRGQDKQINLLRNAIGQGRIAHAFIFHGLDGIGKRSSAMAFAGALNCETAGTDPCGACRSCLKIERGSHPDVIKIEPDGAFIRIKEIRDLQSSMMFRPSEGRYRVFIILDADRMNSTAANALLKTLEEPTGSNILVLITARLYQLPLTVLSRCQKIKFNPLRGEDIIGLLVQKFSVDPADASTLAAVAGGSVGKALEMKESGFSDRRGEIIDRIHGISTPLDFYPVLDCLGSERDAVIEGLEIMKMYFRDVLVLGETGESGKIMNGDRLEIIRSAAERSSKQQVLGSIRIINKAVRALEQNANRQLLLEMMMFRLFGANVRAAV